VPLRWEVSSGPDIVYGTQQSIHGRIWKIFKHLVVDWIGTNSSIMRFWYCVGKFVHGEWIVVVFCIIGVEGNWVFFCILFVSFEKSATMIRERVVRESLTQSVDYVWHICNFSSINIEMADFRSIFGAECLPDILQITDQTFFRGVPLLIFDTKDC